MLTLARLRSYLKKNPHSTAREIAWDLESTTPRRLPLHAMLYGSENKFVKDDSEVPRWRLAKTSLRSAEKAFKARQQAKLAPPKALTRKRIPVPAKAGLQRVVTRKKTIFDERSLWKWQRAALAAWRRKRRLGVIEAVTGTGKTRVGLAAAAEELARGGKVLVIVPTIELQKQWVEKFSQEATTRHARVGRLGAGHANDFSEYDVVVAVVNKARTARIRPPAIQGLLIADECHRYGAKFNQLALNARFPRRLGLTATLDRPDFGHIEWILPYFHQQVYSLTYAQAKRQNIIAPFRVAFVGVDFTGAERKTFDKLSKAIKTHRDILLEYHVTESPFSEFMSEVQRLSKQSGSAREVVAARRYIASFNARLKLLAETKVKYEALEATAPALRRAGRSIVFTQTKTAADRAARTLGREGLTVGVLYSGLRRRTRDDVLSRFRDGDLKVIVAPKILDEGIDVPEADVAVIVTASRSKRQMIQRMGRVIRKKTDNRHARLCVLFVKDTSEDPAKGAHEAFLDQLDGVCEKLRTFGAQDVRELTAFLDERRQPQAKRKRRTKQLVLAPEEDRSTEHDLPAATTVAESVSQTESVEEEAVAPVT